MEINPSEKRVLHNDRNHLLVQETISVSEKKDFQTLDVEEDAPIISRASRAKTKRFRKIKFYLMLPFVVAMSLIKSYSIPNIDVDCIVDKVHDYSQSWNSYVLQNSSARVFLQVSSSLCMDCALVTLALYWVLYGKSSRLIMTLASFYIIRSITQEFFIMTKPAGFYWEYPGIPSLSVPYGPSSDFFYSGHSGFLAICAFEWRACKKKLGFILCTASLLYMIGVLITFRTHYCIDIVYGVMVAHYLFIHCTTIAPHVDNSLLRLYQMIQERRK
mmetsp:Transcript_19397/g.22014  ORF Transcript_19397/g.22014 Transcript_19397/m.22014 type:complete len:273 (+) Transcript_19397:468-1286(+)|eukprot:CAMPEP_0115012782 /NCGR_PEP_ID=MMETSP0216-20121206/24961_1 /TAXON_ID=223996 /ORGANISM="Protocruzia adherens, Strain Boccale" /LENGTH=272 /DNA_ID=CAMNT_0002381943 /DNA_START=362 /DNA_END=1180 /DNA_ORIENTATION=+